MWKQQQKAHEKKARGQPKRKTSSESFITNKTKPNLKKLKSHFGKVIHANKIMRFVKNSAKSFPNLLTKEQEKQLLPKLETRIFDQEEEDDQALAQNSLRFKQLEGNLTNSMVLFKKKTQTESNDLWAVNLQTQKCYHHIPEIFFKQEISEKIFDTHLKLTKDQQQLHENIYTLVDYLDQVQFNINQQVDSKIKIYMNFVFCMNSIQDLVNIDLQKIKETRKKTRLLRDITVSRSIRINRHRLKQQNIQQAKTILEKLKKMKHLQSKLNSLIMLGHFISHDPKNKIGAIFHEYCNLHNQELMKICCQGSTNLCKYWDVTYYVEKGFQEQFTKALSSYISEIIVPQNDIEKFKRAFSMNKKNFMTTPNGSNIENSCSFIDESYEVETLQYIEIVIKESTQREILKTFTMGMQKYNFSTQKVQEEMKNKIYKYLDQLLKDIASQTLSENNISMKNMLVEPENSHKYFSSEECGHMIKKLSWIKYEKTLSIIFNRIQSICHRVFSVINRIISSAISLQQQQPERYQVIVSFMMQIVLVIVQFSDTEICQIIEKRISIKQQQESILSFKSKGQNTKQYDLETENMKSMTRILKKFELSIEKLKGTYPMIKSELSNLYSKPNIQKTQTQKPYFFPNIKGLRAKLIKFCYESFHKSIISKELRQKLEDETWQPVQIPTSTYESIGYIVGGHQFVSEEEDKSRQMLSSSIFLQKSNSGIKQSLYNKEEYSSRFKVNNKYITIDRYKFRLTQSTLEIIQFLKHYLQLYDDTDSIDKQFELHGKITELILMYNQYVKELILKSEALKYGKIKGKSINAKHYLICYIQLKTIDTIICGTILEERIQMGSQESQIMHQKVSATKSSIVNKFRKILQMRILDFISDIETKIDDAQQLQNLSCIPKNFENSIVLFTDFMLETDQYQTFIDLDSKWVQELSNKVNRGSKGKNRKNKYFKYLYEHLMPIHEHIVKSFDAIKNSLE